MNIEVSHDKSTGKFRVSFKRHALVALGLLFVAGGLATLSGPWWQVFVESAFERAGLIVDTEYQWIVGLFQIAIGVALVFYKHFVIDKRLERLGSDASMLQSFDLKPDLVRIFFSDLQNDHSYRSSLQNHFHLVSTRFQLPEHSFRDKEISQRYRRFVESAGELEVFVAQNFWVYPANQSAQSDFRYCLAPQFNADREMIDYDLKKANEYDALGGKLTALVIHAQTEFEEFVSLVKKKGTFS